ncbi:hypothetical protein SBADM41S_10452 [Streptomyces badius]
MALRAGPALCGAAPAHLDGSVLNRRTGLGLGPSPDGLGYGPSVLRQDERRSLDRFSRRLRLQEVCSRPAFPDGGVAHPGADRVRFQSTVWITVAPAGTFRNSGPAAVGQSFEDQIGSSSSPPASVTVSTALFGPKSALHVAEDVFFAISSNFGLSSGP